MAHRNNQTLRHGRGLEVLSRRWLVERTFASLRCCRRLANDIEATIASAEPGSSSRRSALCFAAWQLRLSQSRSR
ncbi:MAG: hypothetical protein EOQ90_24515 [Mesorhizobium sp.]|nr:MAG: hypothetical protein EOQ90_24515 [Mesorhizobium sp.]